MRKGLESAKGKHLVEKQTVTKMAKSFSNWWEHEICLFVDLKNTFQLFSSFLVTERYFLTQKNV